MNSPRATVSRILNFSCVDGPGNRLVVFLQGCNFNCPTCHNPHTRSLCNDCGECVPACPTSALSLADGKIAFDKLACDQCDECLKVCPIGANPMVSTYAVDDIVALVDRHRAFLSGLTVSGGEATLQTKFLENLFAAVGHDPRFAELTRFIDTNGHLGPKGWERLLPVTDGVMLDIKAFDNDLHRRLTARGNKKSLASARLLAEAGKLFEIRFLMIPGQTDSQAELGALADFVTALPGQIRVRLNAFQNHGVQGPAATWPAMGKDGVEQAAAMLRRNGVAAVTTPNVYLN